MHVVALSIEIILENEGKYGYSVHVSKRGLFTGREFI